MVAGGSAVVVALQVGFRDEGVEIQQNLNGLVVFSKAMRFGNRYWSPWWCVWVVYAWGVSICT